MFYAAAKTLAAWVPDDDVLQGKVYPGWYFFSSARLRKKSFLRVLFCRLLGISRIRDVSLKIAVAVCNVALEEGLAGMPKNVPNLEQVCDDD